MGAIVIPRYGSLTVEEVLLVQQYAGSIDPQADELSVRIGLATLLLMCRYDANWKAEQTCKLPIGWIEAIAQFFLNEQRRWKELESEPEQAVEGEGEQRRKKPPAGESSSGNSHGSIPTTQDLVA